MKWIVAFIRYIVGFMAILALWSCGGNNDEPVPPVKNADRTVLVYMVAANSLGQGGSMAADSLDIKEMKLAVQNGHLGRGRWLVYHSTRIDSRLYELTTDSMKLIKEYPSTETSVTIERMREVINDSRSAAPADSYGMVLWSHATGWIEDGIDEPSVELPKPLSFGIHNNKKMNLTSLATALKGFDFDYLYFDCCLMGSIEVAYQLRNCAKYIVSSPSELPFEGTRYDLNMREMIDGSPEALIRAATNTYNHYNSMALPLDRTCSMSVVKTSGLNELAKATAAIYDITPLEHPLDSPTNYGADVFIKPGYYYDFGEYIEALCEAHGVAAELLADFRNALEQVVIYKNATEKLWDKWPMTHVSGLSTRVFNNIDEITVKGYDRLAWTTDVVYHHPEFKTTTVE